MSPGPDDALPNPYNALLIESVRSEVDVHTFSYARALFADWDVLHVHWPEALLYSPSSLRRMGKSVAMVAIVLVARVRRRPLVWTVHNETPHERLKGLPAAVFRLWKSSTNLRIHLNEGGLGTGLRQDGARDVLIPHGVYPGEMHAAGGHERLLYFGAIRRYKGVPALLEAFRNSENDYELRVVGEVEDADLEQQVLNESSSTERISVQFGRLSDADLDAELRSADGVVLPYTDMTNSGAALLALSRGLPVLAPAVPAMCELRAEVGTEWILTVDGRIGAEDISRFTEFLKSVPRDEPDLSRRNWASIGREHVAAYRSAWRHR